MTLPIDQSPWFRLARRGFPISSQAYNIQNVYPADFCTRNPRKFRARQEIRMEIEAKLYPPPLLEGGKVTSFCVTFSLTNGMAVELSPQFTHCFQMAFLDSVYLILYVSICTYI